MNSFHRTKRESRILGFFGLAFVLILSTLFMLLGFSSCSGEISDRPDPFTMVFGFVGIGLFVLFIRGGWMTTRGPIIHLLSIDKDEFMWGFVGDEKSILINEIESFYWSELDEFEFHINPREGKRIRLVYIQNLVSSKSRGRFLRFLREVHSDIPIEGTIDDKTEEAASQKDK